MSKSRQQVIELAERERGLIVQFAGWAGIYELPRTDPGFDRFAPLLRAAKDSGIPVEFETDGHRIVSVG
jgi:hypothetical protein